MDLKNSATQEPGLKLWQIVDALYEATQINPNTFDPKVHIPYAGTIVSDLLKMPAFNDGLEVSIGYYKAKKYKGDWGVEELRFSHFQDPDYSLQTFIVYYDGKVSKIGTIRTKYTRPIKFLFFSLRFISNNKEYILAGANT